MEIRPIPALEPSLRLSELPRSQGNVNLLGILTELLGPLPEHGHRLVTSDTATPSSSDLIGLVEVVGLASRDEVGEGLLVFRSDVVHAHDGRGLLASDQTESCFALDNAVTAGASERQQGYTVFMVGSTGVEG